MKGRPVRKDGQEGWPYGERKIVGVRRGTTEEGYLNKQSLQRRNLLALSYRQVCWQGHIALSNQCKHILTPELHLISLGDMGNGMTNKITIAHSSYGSTNQNQR